MTLIIGLTGSIGTGKSTIANMFKKMAIPLIDADQIARQVVEPNEHAYEKIVEQFGNEILHADGSINREVLGNIIFTDEKKRQQLNAIVHPAIRKEMLRQRDAYVEQGEECVVMDIPLLYESKLTHFVEKVLVVAVDEDVQLERILNRDKSPKEAALKRIQSQIPVAKKATLADAVIDNNGTIEQSHKQLINILTDWGVS